MADDTSQSGEKEITMSAADFQQLMNRVNALENNSQQQPQQNQGGLGLNAMGQVTGTVMHGDTNKDSYEDPTPTLAKEPRLRKFTIDEDYKFEFEVVTKTWEKQGVQHQAPRFRLYVWRTVRNEDDPEKIDGYALVQRADFKEFEYGQIKDWVLSVFYPAKVKARKGTSEMIIGGKLVEFKEHEVIEDVSRGGK